MTRAANARVAGFTFLLYIAAGIASAVLFGQATSGRSAAEKLARVAEHVPEMRLAVVLTLLCGFAAIVLGVTVYGLTRDEDHDLATLAMACRVTEGVLAAVAVERSLGLLWLATAAGAGAPDPASARALGAFLMGQRWSPSVTALFFAVGSTIFSWLMLRGRLVPVSLAWLGVAASALLLIEIPLQIGGLVSGLPAMLVWIPMALFEVALALWLLARGGVAPGPHHRAAPATAVGAHASLAG